jgi:hypothetical protein
MRRLKLALAVLAGLSLAAPQMGHAATCSAADIATAVDQAGERLRAFNSDTMAALSPKLKQLQAARGWSDAELAAKTAALVGDDEVAEFDARAYEQFSRIDQLGSDPSAGDDCQRLERIRGASSTLLGTMQAKAEHLKAKLAEAMQVSEVEAAPKPKTAIEVKPKPKAAPKLDWTSKTDVDPDYAAQQEAALKAFKLPTPLAPPAAEATYSMEDIQATSTDFFGSVNANLAAVIAFAFEKAGRPNGYIVGQEAGGAFLAGVRYGDGKLHLKDGSVTQVFWRGPTIGADLGASQSRTIFLVYHLKSKEDVFKLVSGIDGSAFVLGGVGITFLSDGKTVLAPIRTGPGLRLGVNAGYLKFTPERNWSPF